MIRAQQGFSACYGDIGYCGRCRVDNTQVIVLESHSLSDVTVRRVQTNQRGISAMNLFGDFFHLVIVTVSEKAKRQMKCSGDTCRSTGPKSRQRITRNATTISHKSPRCVSANVCNRMYRRDLSRIPRSYQSEIHQNEYIP